MLCIQSYLVQTPHHNILIDTCCRQRQAAAGPPVLEHDEVRSLREEPGGDTGVGVGDIDFVMCTHLHVDHVGWNTRLENGRWVPTFPKARYVFADRELEYWTKRHKDDPAACPWVTDSVLPIVAANRVDIVKSAARLQRSRHSHPDARPHHRPLLGAGRQAGRRRRHHRRHDPFAAAGALPRVRHDVGLRTPSRRAASRRELFGRFCDTSTLMCTAHFPSPSTGRFVRWKDAFDFKAA